VRVWVAIVSATRAWAIGSYPCRRKQPVAFPTVSVPRIRFSQPSCRPAVAPDPARVALGAWRSVLRRMGHSRWGARLPRPHRPSTNRLVETVDIPNPDYWNEVVVEDGMVLVAIGGPNARLGDGTKTKS
jgi:hypothetical protein